MLRYSGGGSIRSQKGQARPPLKRASLTRVFRQVGARDQWHSGSAAYPYAPNLMLSPWSLRCLRALRFLRKSERPKITTPVTQGWLGSDFNTIQNPRFHDEHCSDVARWFGQ
jgi:hypothetical protein